jgi:hypothetical protein
MSYKSPHVRVCDETTDTKAISHNIYFSRKTSQERRKLSKNDINLIQKYLKEQSLL